MTQEKIKRINELAKKATKERAALRSEYLADVRRNLKAQLDNIEIVD